MELLEEFMFASPGQLSQLAYEASISDAPNASALVLQQLAVMLSGVAA
jgi:hypothetical protein